MKGYIAALLFGAALAAPASHEKRSLVLVEEVVTQWSTVTVYQHKPTGKLGFKFPSGFTRSSSASSTASGSSISSVATISSTSSAPAPPTTSAPAILSSVEPVVAAVVSSVAAVVSSAVAPVASAVAPATGGGPSGTGDITFYSLGLVSCGQTYKDTDAVVALATSVMANGGNSNNNPLCGKSINITYNGVTKTAMVVDTCEGCAPGNIDLSPSLFQEFAPLSAGRVPGVTWSVNM